MLLKIIMWFGVVFFGFGLLVAIKQKDLKLTLGGLVLTITCLFGGLGVYDSQVDQEVQEVSQEVMKEEVQKAQEENDTYEIEDNTENSDEEPSETKIDNEGNVDTSVYVYAEKVEVTDARDITNHLNLVVHMSKEPTPGLATQHVFSQTYDFLQQDDITGADTVTIGVMQSDIRIAQITIDVKKFVPVDTEPMIQCVLKAATIDKMSNEVKEFGKTMEIW